MPTLLVVDDDEHIREFLRKSLPQDLTVVEAADGAQAVAAAKWSHPQVVIMDLEMPVLDGYEAARQIKSDPATKDAVLVAVTGALIENAIPKARAAGFSYFVHKEVGARSFVEKIVKLIREAAALAPAPAPAAVPTPAPEVQAASAPAPLAPPNPAPAPAVQAAAAAPEPDAAGAPEPKPKKKPRKRRKASK
ncbi:MAG TPA: response regulator [Myxococcales bacterium]|jgi:two-component system cell cycle response regulator DivK